ncbi:hypothetical protein J7T55_007749 [Diaporthe amygdali]|uniref:uncharacterized protein n=1 Tax=Phomopsis amygdali TaxID=1214568 RepID=UPI0022FF1A69|nr:uncharacterized protein J7T55_007749 [Diaporthe amygdali]KAJ0107559.1 hypothetical protein J7T55_007749 [Diaporthe amygdali]
MPSSSPVGRTRGLTSFVRLLAYTFLFLQVATLADAGTPRDLTRVSQFHKKDLGGSFSHLGGIRSRAEDVSSPGDPDAEELDPEESDPEDPDSEDPDSDDPFPQFPDPVDPEDEDPIRESPAIILGLQ